MMLLQLMPEILQRTERRGKLYVLATMMLDDKRGQREDWSFYVRLYGTNPIVELERIDYYESPAAGRWEKRHSEPFADIDVRQITREQRYMLQLAVARAVGTLHLDLRPIEAVEAAGAATTVMVQ